MAHLNPDNRRGQILLVTGFALAIAIVGLALILNSVIYTENLATRADATTSEPISHARALETGTERILTYVNEHNTSISTGFGAVEDNFTSAFSTLSAATFQHQLRDGQVTDDGVPNTFRGTWITQTNRNRSFTNETGVADWHPVRTDANGTRNLRIFINETSTLSDAAPFTVLANNSTGGTWTMRVKDGTVNVTETGDDSLDCSFPTPQSHVWINVSAGLVNGTGCDNLDFGEDLGTIQGVEFVNGSNIEGTYQFMVNKSANDVEPGDFGLDTSGPFRKDAIYGAMVEVDFERESLVYRTTIRVVPGENS